MKLAFKFFILLVLTLCSASNNLWAQDDPGDEGDGLKSKITIIDFNGSTPYRYQDVFNLQFRFLFNTGICGPIHLEIRADAKIDVTQVTKLGDDLDPQITVSDPDAGNIRTIRVDFGDLPSTAINQWVNSAITMQGFRMPDRGCGDEHLNIDAKLISDNSTETVCETAIDNKIFTIQTVDNLTPILTFPSAQLYQSGNYDAFFIDVAISKSQANYSLYSKLSMLVDLIDADLQVIKVTRLTTDSYTSYFNIEDVAFNQTGSKVSFESYNLVDQYWGTLYYRIYIDLPCTSVQPETILNASLTVTPTFLESCGGQVGTPIVYTNQTQPFICFDDTERLNRPSVNIAKGNDPCIDGCGLTPITLEIDNLANNSSIDNLEYIMEFPASIYANYIVSSGTDGSRLNKAPDAMYYQACGSTNWILTSQYGTYVPGVHIDRLKVVYYNFPAHSSSDFVVQYFAKSKDCNGVDITSPDNTVHTYFNVGTTLTFPNKNISLNVNTGCNTRTIVDAFEYYPNTWSFREDNGTKITPNTAYHVMIDMTSYRPVSNGSFTYKLNPNLVFASTDVRFAVGQSQLYDESLYQVEDAARVTYYAQLSDMSYTLSGNMITVTGLNLPNNSCNVRDHIYVIVYVKPSARPLAGNFTNEFLDCGANHTDCYNRNFFLYSNFQVKADLFVDCEGKELKEYNLRTKQAFSYNYVFNNIGNEPLSNIVMVATLPYVGDREMFSSQPRNSEYNINRDCGSTLFAREIDPDGVVVNANVPVTIEYKTSSSVCSGDFYIQNYNASVPGRSCGNWNNAPCNNSVKSVRLRTASNYVLGPYNKLIINAGYETAAGIAVGKKAYHSMTAVATRSSFQSSDNNTDYIPGGKVAITIATKSSCEPVVPECKECVTSFSPEPGKKYLLSAWVREDYGDQFPETYKNSGIRLLFNDGVIALPIMKASGPIIDGWQRIESSFTVPQDALNIEVELANLSTDNAVYFDDVRIHPFLSNMKSFVYNPSTQKLTAELDENNYATLYEYDDEGILIRVKKETERGVMTIKETRMNQSKIAPAQ